MRPKVDVPYTKPVHQIAQRLSRSPCSDASAVSKCLCSKGAPSATWGPVGMAGGWRHHLTSRTVVQTLHPVCCDPPHPERAHPMPALVRQSKECNVEHYPAQASGKHKHTAFWFTPAAGVLLSNERCWRLAEQVRWAFPSP